MAAIRFFKKLSAEEDKGFLAPAKQTGSIQAVLTVLCTIAVLFISALCDAQTVPINAGLWQAFDQPANVTQYPQIEGRLYNYAWKDIEPKNNEWSWDFFDSDLANRVKDSLPVIFMIYTYDEAPEWLYSNGVPAVPVTDDSGVLLNTVPYFQDPDYIFYFKRMITEVRKHVDSLPYAIRKWIIGVQACFGSTGDYISYKGNVPSQYALTDAQFTRLYKQFTMHYYTEYNNTNPRIYILSNPNNGNYNNVLYIWTVDYCPRSWLKTGTLGKGFQLNDEKRDYLSLHPLLNDLQSGEYVRSRSEITRITDEGWFFKHEYRNMFAIFESMIYWGVDWSNQGYALYTDTGHNKAYNFYNKYAGQKDPYTATNAFCGFKDGLDASDGVRFPAGKYGKLYRDNTARYVSIANAFAAYGAVEEDPYNATLSAFDNLTATGTNDVNWSIFAVNYERWLHQIDANNTSVGYWNVDAVNDTNSMYGKYARAFEVASGKNALYFDIENSFIKDQPVNAAYPVAIDITYLDKGTGSFRLNYDATDAADKTAGIITCTNSNTWKTASFVIRDAYFGNRSSTASDFYIKNNSTIEDVIFSHVELSKPKADFSDTGFTVTGAPVFDTTCYNGVSAAGTFLLSGHFLDGSNIIVGPLRGFKFSTSLNGVYYDSLIFNNYGSSLTQNIYVKFYPVGIKTYQGNIRVRGGNTRTAYLFIKAASVNSSPALNPVVTTISCNGRKDGAIDISLTGGTGPFIYSWSRAALPTWQASTEDISGLGVDTYTVSISSYAGCSTTASYNITEPDDFISSIQMDSAITCKGGKTTVTITASGGTLPYTGTGTFIQDAGFQAYDVSDARGCFDNASITIPPGTIKVPAKPSILNATDAQGRGICNGGDYVFKTAHAANATFYNWSLPAGSSIVSSDSGGLSITAYIPPTPEDALITVTSGNICGDSKSGFTKSLAALPLRPSAIAGLKEVQIGLSGITYSVANVPGVTYNWTMPRGVIITEGQGTNSVTVTWGSFAGKIVVKAGNDCGYSSGSALAVSLIPLAAPAGMESESAVIAPANNMMITPNPVKDYFAVTMKNGAGISSVSIYSAEGKLLLHKKINSFSVIIHKNELGNQPGVYFADVVSGGTHYKQKVVVL